MPDLIPKVEVLYKSAHRDRPLRPASATALAEVVDEMVVADDFNNSYATVVFHTTRGSIVMLGVGVFAKRGIGAILYQSDTGEYYSKGGDESAEDVFYSDFGNARFFPRDSEIELAQVKTTLAALYNGDGALPGTIQWQQWVDTEH